MKTKLIGVEYLGFTAVDRRFSMSMLPWILLEIRRRGNTEKLCLSVENGFLQAFDVNFELQFSHRLQNIMRFSQIQSSPSEFLYLIKDINEQLLFCHLFQASSAEETMTQEFWSRVYYGTAGSCSASQLSNFEFWMGTILIVLACELDIVYFYILQNIFDIHF